MRIKNIRPLSSLDWQVHVYGEATAEFRALCSGRSLVLHVFPWRDECRRAGLLRDAIYLVRPDGYIGLADRNAQPGALASYLDDRKLRS